MPVDYIVLLGAAAYPLFLVSAYDIANAQTEDQRRIERILKKSKDDGAVVLMDSGQYESFWRGDRSWTAQRFHAVCSTYEHHLSFCHDNQEPPSTADAIADDVIASVLRDQDHAIGTSLPIIHGPSDFLPTAAQKVAKQLRPVLLAVPERILGNGILARTRAIKKLRRALNELGFYSPLHLLGTGNPLSMIAYALAGADSFDGLEWCQTIVDHDTGMLYHFQQWDFFRGQTEWGGNGMLPFIQSALMHNLIFYKNFMQELRDTLNRGAAKEFLGKYFPAEASGAILRVIEGSD